MEKVLGYKYNPKRDTLQISNMEVNQNVKTKRGVLSQTARVWDNTLSFCAPVTVRAKILLRELWSRKLHWDDVIPVQLQELWTALARDLVGLNDLKFPRQAINQDSSLNLCIFCDASPNAYGFVVYGVQNWMSQFIFAKTKVAPMKSKTLPTLELLSAYLAIITLRTLLKSYAQMKLKHICIAVDSQVVLSWLLSENIKAKSQYTRNRLKDVHKMISEIKQDFLVETHFKYVPTAENPADLLSRGISLQKFQQTLQYWTYGPKWIAETPINWSNSNLEYLSPRNKDLVKSTVFHNTISEGGYYPSYPLINFLSWKS